MEMRFLKENILMQKNGQEQDMILMEIKFIKLNVEVDLSKNISMMVN